MGSCSPKFEVAVIGAGPSGLTAAYSLAKKGFKVIVLERGRTPGSKNLYGGRVYSSALEEVYEGFRSEAPVERWVKRERFSIVLGGKSVTIEYSSNSSSSFTAYLSKLTNWMAQKAEEAGAIILTDIRVDDIWVEDNSVKGIKAGSDKLQADVVIDAEGINRILLERMGVVPKLDPNHVAIGLKQVIRLDEERINERFGLEPDEGIAWFLMGEITKGIPGGGFLYTNSTTVSLGLVLFLWGLKKPPSQHVFEILEDFRLSPLIKKFIGDGVCVEYGAHLTPEIGLGISPKKLYGNGFLVVGDAAGLLLNLGYTVRGVDFAVYSGYLAAKAFEKAHSEGEFSAENLSYYQKLLEESFVMSELKKHTSIAKLLRNETVFKTYPEILVNLASKLYEIKWRSPTILEALKEVAKGKTLFTQNGPDIIDLVKAP